MQDRARDSTVVQIYQDLPQQSCRDMSGNLDNNITDWVKHRVGPARVAGTKHSWVVLVGVFIVQT
jgi:formylglycine-generating enzyme required for sulfatase activity